MTRLFIYRHVASIVKLASDQSSRLRRTKHNEVGEHMSAKSSLGAVGAAVLIAATPLAATATPITYTLEGVSATFTGGTVDFTGSFVYDPTQTTFGISGADENDITLTGSDPPLAISPQGPDVGINTKCRSCPLNTITFVADPGWTSYTITFTPDLADIPNPVAAVTLSGPDGTFASQSVQGEAVPVPEPSTITLLGGAISLFLLASGAGRRGRQTCPGA
jgi:hypothetical protein